MILKRITDLSPQQLYKFIKYNRILWFLVILPLIFLYSLIALISLGKVGYIPPFDELENPKSNLATEIYSADGKLLGKYYLENRTIVDFNELSPNILAALVATEDIRFYRHSGIDFRALGRVLFKSILLGKSAGGGSTITQQLAKNLYKMRQKLNIHAHTLPGKIWKMLIMKLQEWVTAARLERRYAKNEILVMYLNTVTFGHNAFGIKAAAKTFFGTTPDSLSLEQAATLVGLLRAPTYYSPVLHPDRSLRRRNAVLSQVEKYQKQLQEYFGWKPLTHKQFDSLRALPIVLHYKPETHNRGLATYFREYLRQYLTARKPDPKNYPSWNMEQYHEDSLLWETDPLYGWCNKNLKPDGTPYDIYRDGLKIYTTIDSRMQQYAEQAVSEHLKEWQKVFENHYKHRYLKSLVFKAKGVTIKVKNPDLKAFDPQLTRKDIARIIWNSMRRSSRWFTLKALGKTDKEIVESFLRPAKMRVFSWHGEVDTVMTPLDSILYYKKFLRAGFLSVEPRTGYVRAYVGGINFMHFKYDQVMQARRQVGSTFKPFVYTLAMMPGGFSPCYKVPNVPVTFEVYENGQKVAYTPQYSHSKFDGQEITLKTGLALSLNQISAWVMKHYSPEAVIEIARAMGIRSPLPAVPSLCVGAAEVKLGEMVGAYTTFANEGIHVQPIFVKRIEDRYGNVLATFTPHKNQAIDASTAWRMIVMMRAVVNYGTSVRLRYKYQFTNDIAGKTGTTNDNSDGWFIGMVPKLVSGAWVGGEERSIRFTSTALGQGASMALPIWALYMKKIYADPVLNKIYSVQDSFAMPVNYDGVPFECEPDIPGQQTVSEQQEQEINF